MLYKSEASAFVHTTDTTAGCKEHQKREKKKKNSYIGKKYMACPFNNHGQLMESIYIYIERERERVFFQV